MLTCADGSSSRGALVAAPALLAPLQLPGGRGAQRELPAHHWPNKREQPCAWRPATDHPSCLRQVSRDGHAGDVHSLPGVFAYAPFPAPQSMASTGLQACSSSVPQGGGSARDAPSEELGKREVVGWVRPPAAAAVVAAAGALPLVLLVLAPGSQRGRGPLLPPRFLPRRRTAAQRKHCRPPQQARP